ncbi:MAG: ArnT family glycosyltransferase, partial [Cryomorphaceae bacterium]
MQGILQNTRFYHFLFAVLLLPALLINLDAHHLFVHTDEGRRALVALEMILKNEYLAPTLNGEFYYEKPPLFNWILVASFKLFGSYSAFALRFPVVVFTLGFAWSIVAFLKPIMGNKKAWLVMAASITTGRILFYDSFLGLIDIGLAVLVFVNFMLFYVLGRQKRYLLLFALTYIIAAVGYLMKGLPSLVFQFFTIVAYAVYIKDWKFIFHKYNFLCTLIFILPVGAYYYFYEQVNPGSFATVMD